MQVKHTDCVCVWNCKMSMYAKKENQFCSIFFFFCAINSGCAFMCVENIFFGRLKDMSAEELRVRAARSVAFSPRQSPSEYLTHMIKLCARLLALCCAHQYLYIGKPWWKFLIYFLSFAEYALSDLTCTVAIMRRAYTRC